MTATQAENSSEVDRLCELANIGAGHAATAFAQLTGSPVWMDVPRVFSTGVAQPDDMGTDSSVTGIFFEVEGSVGALLAILFDRDECEAVTDRLLGDSEGAPAPEAVKAVLTEVGNILASHVVSAIADTVGGRLLPSVPFLVMDDAVRALAERAERRAPIRIESVLRDESGELGARLVLVPDSGCLI